MPPDGRANPYRPLVVAGVLVALAYLLSVGHKIFIPIALGILLAFILTPAVSFLQARGLRRVTAVILVVLLTSLVVAGILTGVAIELRELASDLPGHKEHIAGKVRDLFGSGRPGIFDNLTRMIDEITVEMQAQQKQETAILVRVQHDRSSGLGLLALLAGPLAATLGSISLTIGLTVSMLLMREDLRNRLFLLLGEGHLTSTTRAMDDASQRISHHLLTQAILNTAFGTVFGIGLALMDVRYALVWGVLAALLRFVPYIGTWMAAFFPVIVSIATEGWVQPLLVIAYVAVLGVLTNYVVEPRLVSRSTGVTPIALVVTSAFWTWLWGPIGLILSTPMTVCLSVLGKYVPSLRFLDVLLGSAAPLDPDLKFYQRLLAHDEIEAGDLLEAYLAEHSQEDLFDDVIVPALARARLDNERGHLHGDELLALVRTTRELLDGILGDAEEGLAGGAVLLACPAHDAVDGLAVELLARVTAPKARVVVASPEATVAEVLVQVEEKEAAVACLVGVPPGGSARARLICKRLRARYPQLPIVAAVLGSTVDEPLMAQLRSAGATQLATTLAEARGHAAPLLQVARHLETV